MTLVLVALGAAVGIAAEVYSGADLRHALPDLLTGWALIGAGVLVRRRQGPLLALSGFAWFAGSVWPVALYWNRGPLLHFLFTEPGGRPRSRTEVVAVTGAYATALMPPIWSSEPTTLALSAAIAGVGGLGFIRARGAARRRRSATFAALALLAAVLAGGALARLANPGGEADEAALLAYETVLCAIAIGAAAGVPRKEPLTDLVVELGERPADALRDELRRALGDPTLEIGLWDPASGRYLDANGRALELERAGRAVTLAEPDGAPTTALVHDPALLEDPLLVEALTTATRLAHTNRGLRERVEAQLAELDGSRRRLLEAADDERRRLADRIHGGVRRSLSDIEKALAAASASAREPGRYRIQRATEVLGQALDDLDAIARGLHPFVGEQGLQGALALLGDSGPVRVELEVTGERFDPRLEAGAYFVCAEALSNVLKHADATRARISVERRDSQLVLAIADDGRGGAERPQALADRVDALGGRLEVASATGAGTRVIAVLPLNGSGASHAQRTALR
jgi:signal transduction histidine kinase